jgi:hypothetical protein
MPNNESVSMNGFFENKLDFFGAKGGLPLSFTDRILQNTSFDEIDNFFNEMLFLLEEIKITVLHSCLINLITNKFKQNSVERKVWKTINIYNYNRIGKDKIGFLILGHRKRYIGYSTSHPLGKINFIKVSKKL